MAHEQGPTEIRGVVRTRIEAAPLPRAVKGLRRFVVSRRLEWVPEPLAGAVGDPAAEPAAARTARSPGRPSSSGS
jgi:hypothetical protein